MSMTTKPNIITANGKEIKFYKYFAIDSESLKYKDGNEEIQKFFNYDLYDGNEHYYSEQLENLEITIYQLLRKYEKITIFDHNWKYDLKILQLLDKIIQQNYLGMNRQTLFLDNIIYIKFTSPNNKFVLQLIDSTNYFKTSLASLAKMFKLEKYAHEEYYYSFDKWNEYIKKNGKELCQRDTEILYKVMNEFLSMSFAFGISIAQTSFLTFKKQFLKTQIVYEHNLDDIALKFYRGAIVYPYNLTTMDYRYYYDINNLYGYVMRNNKFSIAFRKEIKPTNHIYKMIKSRTYNYLLNVNYSGNNRSPILEVINDKRILLNENDDVWISGAEYIALIDNGFFVKINRILQFHNAYLFTEFVDYFTKKRNESDNEAHRNFYKLIINSNYGKWSQHKGHSEIIPFDELEPIEQFLILRENAQRVKINDITYSIYDDFVSMTTKGEIKYSPIIAGEITAYARIENYNWQKLIGFDNVDYTDTDSFISKVKLDDKYISKTELGKVKLEAEGYFTIHGSKDYEYIDTDGNYHRTLKGVPKSARMIDSSHYELYRWEKIKSKHNNEVRIIPYVKEIKRESYKMNGKIQWKNKEEYITQTLNMLIA